MERSMWSEDERQALENLLRQERERAMQALDRFQTRTQELGERAGELSTYRQHPADIGSEAMEQEKEFLLASNEGRRLNEIEEALQRLYKDPDGFGSCERCDTQIAFERLEVIPYTRYCTRCRSITEEE
jgi:DnaK suppressor protein